MYYANMFIQPDFNVQFTEVVQHLHHLFKCLVDVATRLRT